MVNINEYTSTLLHFIIIFVFHCNLVPCPLSVPSLADLYSIPEVDSRWYEIGISLSVDLNSLLNIKEQAHKNDFKKKRDMFKVFHEAYPHASWRHVLKALVDTGEEAS